MPNIYLLHKNVVLEYRRLKRLAFPGCEKQYKEYKHDWYLDHKDWVIQKSNKRIKDNPKKHAEYMKKSAIKNRSKRLLWGRRYVTLNRPKIRAQARLRYANNTAKYLDKNHRKRIRLKANGDNCEIKINLLRKKCFCRWCCVRLTDNNRTIDHIIPLSRGGLHVSDNLAAACKKCNFGRRDKLIEEWTWEIAA